jgi:nucleotidyltransferase/DNA polymerase involved in DNA repair
MLRAWCPKEIYELSRPIFNQKFSPFGLQLPLLILRGDIWRIGRKTSEKLKRCGIYNAAHFVDRGPVWVKKCLTIKGLMTQLELKGQPCIPLAEKTAPPKSIQVSRTWGHVL